LLKRTILSLFENHHIRLTPSDLDRLVRRMNPGFSSKAVRTAIKEMVIEGSLAYTNHFNTTHLELNFFKAVRVSPRLLIIPHGRIAPQTDDELRAIMLVQGSAFGMGDHPTTRLALRAMDSVMANAMAETLNSGIHALDIGTGSGVLAIAAARLGAQKVVALDIDPLALYEARNNICLNGLDRVIAVSDEKLEKLPGNSFNLILANLRPPTLKQILPSMESVSSGNGYWVLSGFRREDMEAAIRILPPERTSILSRESAGGWAAVSVNYFHP
jgi:ribosomal protein L11 methyltransferase